MITAHRPSIMVRSITSTMFRWRSQPSRRASSRIRLAISSLADHFWWSSLMATRREKPSPWMTLARYTDPKPPEATSRMNSNCLADSFVVKQGLSGIGRRPALCHSRGEEPASAGGHNLHEEGRRGASTAVDPRQTSVRGCVDARRCRAGAARPILPPYPRSSTCIPPPALRRHINSTGRDFTGADHSIGADPAVGVSPRRARPAGRRRWPWWPPWPSAGAGKTSWRSCRRASSPSTRRWAARRQAGSWSPSRST